MPYVKNAVLELYAHLVKQKTTMECMKIVTGEPLEEIFSSYCKGEPKELLSCETFSDYFVLATHTLYKQEHKDFLAKKIRKENKNV